MKKFYNRQFASNYEELISYSRGIIVRFGKW